MAAIARPTRKINESDDQTQEITKREKEEQKEKLVTKTAPDKSTFDGNNVKYTVDVNPSSKTLNGDAKTISCVDNLYYDWDIYNPYDVSFVSGSVKVWEVTESGEKEISDFSYTMDESQEIVNNKTRSHKIISFTLPDSKHLKIEYEYHFSGPLGNWNTLYNTFSINGSSQDNTSAEKKVDTCVSESGGVFDSTGINFYKVDAANYNKLLSGGKFTLKKYVKNQDGQGEWSVVREKIHADEKGLIDTSNLITYNVAYCLTEEEAPDGYERGDLGENGYKFILRSTDTTKYPISQPDDFDGEECTTGAAKYLTNSKVQTTSYSIEKVWSDGNNQDGIRPGDLTLTLEKKAGKDGDWTEVTGRTPTVTKNDETNTWTYSWNELPEKEGGKTLSYRAVEKEVPDGYEKSVSSDGKTITNTHTPEVVSASITKIWDDENNRDNKRPASIEVKLTAKVDGSITELSKTATLNAANGWKASWVDLPKYHNGQLVEYSADEVNTPAGYTTSVSGDMEKGFTITNRYTPETVQVAGSKNWNDSSNAEGLRPESITIRLYANGSEIGHKTVTEKDGWSWNWTGLNRYDTDHKEISYTISEDAVDGYTSSISGYNVTNTVNKPQVGSVILTKVDATTGTALAGAVFDLYRANNTKVGTYTTNAGGVLRVDGLTFGDYYFVETKAPEGYALESQRAAFTINAATTVSAPASVRVTNKPVDEKIGVSAAKVWDDENNTDGVRPSSVTFHLFADGVEIGSAQASEANGWTVSFGNLPKTRNGVAISYAVKEDEVGNYYEASYETGLGSDGSYVFTVKNYRETDKHYEERTGSVRGANRNKPSNGGVAGAGRGRGTGDESDMTVYGTVSGASLLALIVWMIARRKRAGKGTK